MLKFKGKPWGLKTFFAYLKHEYGAKVTIKEILEKERVGK
jgi:hypothetical protein